MTEPYDIDGELGEPEPQVTFARPQDYRRVRWEWVAPAASVVLFVAWWAVTR